MYLDREASMFPFYRHKPRSIPVRLIKYIYSKYVWLLLSLDRKIVHWQGIDIPSIDYEMADFWATRTRHLEHDKIGKVFEEQNFEYFIQEDYHPNRVRFFNPFFYIYKNIYKPDCSLWIAKK